MLLTVDDVTRRAHYRNAYRTLRKLLDLRAVPIVNENDTVATEEIRFGDNDRLAALVAALVARRPAGAALRRGRALDRRPGPAGQHAGSPRCAARTTWPASTIGGAGRAGVGTGGMVTKVEAARIATGFGIPVVLTSAPLAAAGAGRRAGRHAVPPGSRQRPTARLFWLAHATSPRGRLHLDPGAVQAVVGPAQVAAAGRHHRRGRRVHRRRPGRPGRPAGAPVARGLVNYDAVELPGLLGRSTADLAAALGPAYEREVVHRDDLVLL